MKWERRPNHNWKRNSTWKRSFSLWWEFKRTIHFELLPTNATIKAQISCQQISLWMLLWRKKTTKACFSKSKQGGGFIRTMQDLMLQRSHHRRLRNLAEKKIALMPYSPGLAPSIYHLFYSLQNHLNDLTLKLRKLKLTFQHFLVSLKPKKFLH